MYTPCRNASVTDPAREPKEEAQQLGTVIETVMDKLQSAMHMPKATELAPGVTLYTKDGTLIGNGIVIKEVKPHPSAEEYLKKTNQKVWLVETDFGNQTRLCDREIEEFYTLGVQSDYDKWWDDRCEAIKKTVEP
jgi:hypothetical protein